MQDCKHCGDSAAYICIMCKNEFFCANKCSINEQSACIPSGNLEEKTLHNTDYRHVKWTTSMMQVVLMSLPEGDYIDSEIHEEHDQFFRVESGHIKVIINDTQILKGGPGFACIIPKGTRHEIWNDGSEPLKLYTIYSPPEHAPDKVNPTHT